MAGEDRRPQVTSTVPASITRDGALAWCHAQQWAFAGYYKYRFRFTASDGVLTGEVSAGGDTADIYRYDITRDGMSFGDLLAGGWDFRVRSGGVTLYEGDDEG
jgi:hypothetical protein